MTTPAAEMPLRNATAAALKLDRVSFHYDGVPAVEDVSLCIARGESVALLGANGSGKSTLLRILNGLASPSSGVFRAYGEDIAERALKDEATSHRFRRRVGFVFQNADAQLFCATVREELAFGPLQMNLPAGEVESRIADVAAMLEIDPLLDRPPFQLSGGEKRKVAIGSVLAINPDVILLDEPTTGLDPRSQMWLIELLATLCDVGKTIVSATHDLDIVTEIADRAVILGEDHRIAADGPSAELLADRDLLLRVNLIHEHSHFHQGEKHTHAHHHAGPHEHNHHDA
jgi:cobalt/nickel transport system ATP-binding protein